MFLKAFFIICRLCLAGLLIGAAAALMIPSSIYLYLSPRLPTIEGLRHIKLQEPMRIYTADGSFIAQFGEKYRTPVRFENVPDLFVKAILAAEDDRFFTHPGIDLKSLARAAVQLSESGHIQSGGSTITMQVIKNYLLSPEKTFLRKFNEILLALRIEQTLSKQEILELYFNVIYMGNRAYGVEAAAKRYYGKPLAQLTLAQWATLAALPKAPSVNNPITNPDAALIRRNWILERMLILGYISQPLYQKALHEPINTTLYEEPPISDAAYVAEMVRDDIFKKYSESSYSSGWKIYTSIDSALQAAANKAVVDGLIAYDKRHGYRGAEAHYDLSSAALPQSLIKKYPIYGDLSPAIVSDIHVSDIDALLPTGEKIKIDFEELAWAATYINADEKGKLPRKPGDVVKKGDVIRIKKSNVGKWQFVQLPQAEAALIAMDPNDGAIRALVGGFAFERSKFNRATQAARQPGSSFKPFIYSAALDAGFMPSSIVEDTPIEIDNGYGKFWKPQNSDGKFLGPIRLREALYKSRNMVSVRLLKATTLPVTLDYLSLFGFHKKELPHEFSLALGTASVTPLRMTDAYATFANGGYDVSPYFIERIINREKQTLFQEKPLQVCRTCASSADNALRVIDEKNAFMINHMLSDVIRLGTAKKAAELQRSDLSGKTGTTNDQKDNWFIGYNANLVTAVWVGFDEPKTLGHKEFGATTALPIWMTFMGQALHNKPEQTLPQPDGLVMAKINPATGSPVNANNTLAIFELFRAPDLTYIDARKSETESPPPHIPEPEAHTEEMY